jgi:predicted DNA-binding transcriptional regulator AlpA
MPSEPSSVKPKLIMRPAAREMLGGISASTERHLLKADPTFPRLVQVSPGRSGYVFSELEQFVDARIARREAGVAPASVVRGRELSVALEGKRGSRPRKVPQALE